MNSFEEKHLNLQEIMLIKAQFFNVSSYSIITTGNLLVDMLSNR